MVFSDERRVEVQRRTADGWRVDDPIGQAEIRLACCDAPIPLDTAHRDLLPAPPGSRPARRNPERPLLQSPRRLLSLPQTAKRRLLVTMRSRHDDLPGIEAAWSSAVRF